MEGGDAVVNGDVAVWTGFSSILISTISTISTSCFGSFAFPLVVGIADAVDSIVCCCKISTKSGMATGSFIVVVVDVLVVAVVKALVNFIRSIFGVLMSTMPAISGELEVVTNIEDFTSVDVVVVVDGVIDVVVVAVVKALVNFVRSFFGIFISTISAISTIADIEDSSFVIVVIVGVVVVVAVVIALVNFVGSLFGILISTISAILTIFAELAVTGTEDSAPVAISDTATIPCSSTILI